MTDRTAGCLCGAVRLRISDMPSGFGACHCEMCRRWTGAAFLAVETPAAGVTVERGADRIARYQSSGWAERAWCGTCGSHLWYRVTRAGHAGAGCHEIPLGLLDDPSGLAFEREIYIDCKPGGFAFAGQETRETLTRAETFALYAPGPEG
ncbi:MAG: GFA family protein [Paracoccaceae bacterium]